MERAAVGLATLPGNSSPLPYPDRT